MLDGIELSFKSISKETFIKTLNDSNSVNDVLSKLNITKHAYNALRKKYKINVNMNKKIFSIIPLILFRKDTKKGKVFSNHQERKRNRYYMRQYTVKETGRIVNPLL